MAQTSGLTVRQFERRAVALNVDFVVADAHTTQVRFSASSSAGDQRCVSGKAADISSGGMGLVLRHFVPRMCEGFVRIYSPRPSGKDRQGNPTHDVGIEQRVRVRRVVMCGREPSYAVGVAFIDPQPDLESRLARIMAEAAALADQAQTEPLAHA